MIHLLNLFLSLLKIELLALFSYLIGSRIFLKVVFIGNVKFNYKGNCLMFKCTKTPY